MARAGGRLSTEIRPASCDCHEVMVRIEVSLSQEGQQAAISSETSRIASFICGPYRSCLERAMPAVSALKGCVAGSRPANPRYGPDLKVPTDSWPEGFQNLPGICRIATARPHTQAVAGSGHPPGLRCGKARGYCSKVLSADRWVCAIRLPRFERFARTFGMRGHGCPCSCWIWATGPGCGGGEGGTGTGPFRMCGRAAG